MYDKQPIIATMAKSAWNPDFGTVPGTTESRCFACFTTVLIAPSTRKIIDQHHGRIKVLCSMCAQIEVVNAEVAGKPFTPILHPESVKEFDQWLRNR